MKQIRDLCFYKDYFKSFYEAQIPKVKDKIDLGLYYLQYMKIIPNKFVGSTKESNLYYLRIKQSSNIFRIFFCYDGNTIVVLMNGFQKKTQKTPKNEVRRALRIKKYYFDEKK